MIKNNNLNSSRSSNIANGREVSNISYNKSINCYDIAKKKKEQDRPSELLKKNLR